MFATCRPPFPLESGARIRTHRLLTGLARTFDTTLLTFEFEPGHPDGAIPRRELERLLPGVSVLTVAGRRSGKRASQIASLARRDSWTNGRYRTAAFTAALTRVVARNAPHIVHFDDPGVALVPPFPDPMNVYCAHNVEQTILRLGARVGDPTRRAFNAVEALKVAREERRIWRRVDLCLAASPLDGAVMAAAGARRVEVCPNGADPVQRLPVCPRQPEEPLRLLFVGSGDYAPYERGLAWMVEEVLPLVRSQVPVQFDVVGAPPARPIPAEGVRYIGRVPTVEPYYDAAHVVVVPVFEGSGTRLKIVEAAAFGRPVVSTRLGAEGLPLTAGAHFRQADDAQDFASAVLALERRWRQPGDVELDLMLEGAHEAVQPLMWPRIVEDMTALYRSELARRGGERLAQGRTPVSATHAQSPRQSR